MRIPKYDCRSYGDLTLDIPKVSNLFVSGHTILVKAGGKIKLTGGRQIAVLPNTLYEIE